MTSVPPVSDVEIADAVEYFWQERMSRAENRADIDHAQEGRRKEVTSGGHMAEFEGLLYDLLVDAGLPESAIYTGKSADLPGYYRPSKEWDLVVLQEGDPVAAIEFKSQTSSFGNNWNNRVEEVVGSATDFRTAMEKGVIDSPVRPWLGYVYLMDEQGTLEGDSISATDAGMADAFVGASYADRCEELCLRLLDNGIYDGASFLLSGEEAGLDGAYRTPHDRLKFERFAASLVGHVGQFLDEYGQRQAELGNY